MTGSAPPTISGLPARFTRHFVSDLKPSRLCARCYGSDPALPREDIVSQAMNIAATFAAPPLTRWMNTLVDYVRSGEPHSDQPPDGAADGGVPQPRAAYGARIGARAQFVLKHRHARLEQAGRHSAICAASATIPTNAISSSRARPKGQTFLKSSDNLSAMATASPRPPRHRVRSSH